MSITLTGAQKYYALIVALFGLVVLTYATKLWPAEFGLAGISTIVLSLVGFIVHDLEDAHTTPSSVPGWVTFLLITVAAALMSGVSVITGVGSFWSVSVWVPWLIVVLGFIAHQVAEDAGASAPKYVEAWVTAGTGLGLALLTFIQSNPTVSAEAVLTTLLVVFPQYIHLETTPSGFSVTPASATPATP